MERGEWIAVDRRSAVSLIALRSDQTGHSTQLVSATNLPVRPIARTKALHRETKDRSDRVIGPVARISAVWQRLRRQSARHGQAKEV
jgi:hypothetical protein